MGLVGVAIKAYESLTGNTVPIQLPQDTWPDTWLHHDWVSVVMFAALAYSLYYFARKPLKK
uniref:Uncharacterized protein n=1 Tax=mine drainage metagenome TaxID=410659 RepID=E6QNB4_9ZZZZ